MFNDIVMIDWRRPLAARRAARKTCGPYRWRPCPAERGRGFYVSMLSETRVDEAGSSIRLRFEQAARHWDGARAWRGDCGLDAWTPIVGRLNHGRGFLAGASLGCGMLAFVDAGIFTDACDAAMAADDAARQAAEADAAMDCDDAGEIAA